ncbi:alpha/beta fold hydrolase [Roseovarius sp. S88]|uniref:Alpha/beta fold hydrolase n=1 Tax=Roseovarius phycicola TaxID=3080976 RepID=A0ABZ2HF40_9RHOB
MVWSLWVLEGARKGIEITYRLVGDTPVTVLYRQTDGPAVVVAHGFSGSRQMMQGYSHLLAQAGYRVFAFDFQGHGRHRTPMSGDVNAINGTTRLLMAQTQEVIKAARQGDAPVALLGHSMATDILIRVANETEGIGPLVLLSAFSEAVSESWPCDMLLITGAWEPGLREFALETAEAAQESARRAAFIAPAVEHVSILQSRAGREAALDWLNGYFERNDVPKAAQTGWALVGLLAAVTLFFPFVARIAPGSQATPEPINWRLLLLAAGGPALLTPPLATLVEAEFLPVLVADYLMVHLLIYGALQLCVLVWAKRRLGPISAAGLVLLLFWMIAVFGLALDRYGASFWPTPERWAIIAVLCVGAVPFMLADANLSYGATLTQRILARVTFLASLGLAVALDFDALFFLVMIAPVIVLFYLSFGYMGRVSALRSGPTGAGIALGLALAWAIGVSFPLFAV